MADTGTSSSAAPESPPSPADLHLWEFQWVRDLGVLLVAAALCLVGWQVRAILLPVVVGLALAYIFNPVVTWADRRWKVPRWTTTLGLLLVVPMIVIGLLIWLVPQLVHQLSRLFKSLPEYLQEVAQKVDPQWKEVVVDIEARIREWIASATQGGEGSDLGAISFSEIASFFGESVVTGLNVVGSAISITTYLGLFVVLLMFCFFYFSWKFDPVIKWVDQFIPSHRRERVHQIVGQMDMAVSSFLRGRLAQAIILGIILSIGWKLCGVPYWLVLGMGAGLCNLIPFVAVIGWPLAVLLAWMDTLSGGQTFNVWWVVVGPSVVYFIGQGLDGWVVEPIVQGKATNLDPLSVMLAVVIGGSLAGLLGMLIAIPVAACIKIMGQEVLVPHLKAYAERAA